jgi:hypothetical protein
VKTFGNLVRRQIKMTDAQICEMVNRHRVLIRNEMKMLIHRINHEPNAEVLQEAFNDTQWIEFAKWFKEIRDE